MLEMVIIQINSSVDISSEIEERLNEIRDDLNYINSPREEAYYNYALALKYRAQFRHRESVLSAKNAIDIC